MREGGPPLPKGLPKISYACPTMMKLDTVILLLKKIQKTCAVRHPLRSTNISVFKQKLTIFIISRNKDKNCLLMNDLRFFWILLSFFKKFVLKNKIETLMISTKLTTSGFPKITLFRNKGFVCPWCHQNFIPQFQSCDAFQSYYDLFQVNWLLQI